MMYLLGLKTWFEGGDKPSGEVLERYFQRRNSDNNNTKWWPEVFGENNEGYRSLFKNYDNDEFLDDKLRLEYDFARLIVKPFATQGFLDTNYRVLFGSVREPCRDLVRIGQYDILDASFQRHRITAARWLMLGLEKMIVGSGEFYVRDEGMWAYSTELDVSQLSKEFKYHSKWCNAAIYCVTQSDSSGSVLKLVRKNDDLDAAFEERVNWFEEDGRYFRLIRNGSNIQLRNTFKNGNVEFDFGDTKERYLRGLSVERFKTDLVKRSMSNVLRKYWDFIHVRHRSKEMREATCNFIGRLLGSVLYTYNLTDEMRMAYILAMSELMDTLLIPDIV